MVRLHVLEGVPVRGGRVGRHLHEVGERGGAVDLGLALAEQVQVGPREQEDGGGHADQPPTPTAPNATSRARASGSCTVSRPSGSGQHEGEPTDRLLVAPHRRQERVAVGRAGYRGREIERGDHVAVVGNGLAVDPFERTRERAGEHQTDRYRLAVQQLVAPDRLERVPERVAEVERGPQARALLRIGRDHVCLHRCTRSHQLGEHIEIAGHHRGRVPVDDLGDPRPAGHERVLGDLAQTGAVLARRQRRQRGDVGEHTDRLVERADQVLALGQVDRGLAADGGVDLGEQRGRGLHDGDRRGGTRTRRSRRYRRPPRRPGRRPRRRAGAPMPPSGDTGRRRWRASWRLRPHR